MIKTTTEYVITNGLFIYATKYNSRHGIYISDELGNFFLADCTGQLTFRQPCTLLLSE